MAGINPVEDKPGFRHVLLAPKPDARLRYAKASLESAAGLYESGWIVNEDGELNFRFVIPFHATATIELPDAKLENVLLNGKPLKDQGIESEPFMNGVRLQLVSGIWEFAYMPEADYIYRYSTYFPVEQLLLNDEAKQAVSEVFPQIGAIPTSMLSKGQSLRYLSQHVLSQIQAEVLDALDLKLKNIKYQ
ncbi:alpha-L-rhamnosidase C-terminal domain-containing protein [Paenibacillus prosopidis]|nr:alpha-L-rhamnosidase C-terminal domain-containing protein [Paenibacillus prosopidis]